MIRQLVEKNRSYRRFDRSVKLTEEQILGWIENAHLAGSAANLQPLKYKISLDEEGEKAVFPNLKWAGYLTDWAGPEPEEMPTAYLTVMLDKEISSNPFWDHGIAAQTILLSAAEEGFGGCMFGAIDKHGLRKALGLADHLEILMVIALGKPVETVVLEPFAGDVKYYRDEAGVHHVPKRPLVDLIIK